MIPRTLRADPRALFAVKHRILRAPWATVRFIKTGDEGGIAVVVSKKAAKLSVSRHLAKRRVAAALLSVRTPGISAVVMLNAVGAKARSAELKTWCQELWDRILEPTYD